MVKVTIATLHLLEHQPRLLANLWSFYFICLKVEDEAIAKDKFLVQLTPAPASITGNSLEGKELMTQLIAAWNLVQKKDRCEFKLRVAKRKSFEGPGAAELTTSAGPAKIAGSAAKAAPAEQINVGDSEASQSAML